MKHKPVDGDKMPGIMGDVYNSVKRAQAALANDPSAGTGSSLVERDLQKKLEQYGRLSAYSWMDRSHLSSLDQIASATAMAVRINDSAQKFMGQSDSLESLASKVKGNSSHIPAHAQIASVTDMATQINGAAQKFMAMRSLVERTLNGYSTRSGDHYLKDMDSVKGSIASKCDIEFGDVLDKYKIPIAPLRRYQEEPITPPVFDFNRCIAHEHREEHVEPRKERPLVKKKNCPEEVYTPNEGQIRDRLLDALKTYLDDHKKTIQQEIDKFPTLDTEADRKEYEDLRFMYQYPFDQAAKIESQDILLLPEDELRQRFRENPDIRTYIYMGLQTIISNSKQLYNDPDFIEAQRRKVAYNFNSFNLDEDTDYLLSYETMRWLERERNDGIVIACTNEQTENIASAIRKPGRKVKLTMDVFIQEIYPEMKKRFPDSKHVSGKKAYCTEIGEKYGVSEKTIRDKFDECNLGE